MMTTGGAGSLLVGGRKMKKGLKGRNTLPPEAKTKANPPGGNASFEKFRKTKRPKARGRRTIGDRYGITI
jgi:hypothetical protein